MTLEPLRVTAHLAQGYSSADPWSPALDGILAYWRLREVLGEEQFTLQASDPDALVDCEDLPLGREEHDGWWWWQCSAPIAAPAARFDRHYHRRFDAAQAERLVSERVRRVMTAAGPYKAYRHRATVTLVPSVTWHCLGDAAEVERLLRRSAGIGFGVSKGYGRVTRWEVTPDGNAALARFHRPLPVAFAAAHGVRGPQLDWGIRPPGRLLRNRTRCVMPELR